MYVAINYQHEGKMPPGMSPEDSKQWWNMFNGNFQNQELDTAALIAAIQAGHAYTTHHNRYRKADNFMRGQHIALDFDTDDERSTFDYLLQDSFIANHAAFLHTTPSHTDETPRCRVVFILDRPIHNADKFTLLAESLVYRFGLADRKCKDACRLFFGASGCQVHELANVLTLETAATELVAPYRDFLERQAAEHKKRLETMQVVSANDVPEKILEAHARALLDRVQSAPDGEKYGTLRDISRTFGGYVGGGYYSRLDVENWLQAAIAANPNNVRDLSQANAAIRQGIEYGMSDPLYFEQRQTQPPPPPELERVQPALTPEQHQQVEAIIADIAEREYWRGYHDGMTSEQRGKWLSKGFTDWVIDHYSLGYARANVATGEIVEALTVPFYGPDGEIVNIEYRPESGGVSYEYDLMPSLFFTDAEQTAVSILVDNSLTAMLTYLNFGLAQLDGERISVVGLPEMALTPDSLDALRYTALFVIVSPDFDPAGRGLQYVKNKARFLRLPQPVETLRRYGMDSDGFGWLLKQAKVLA